MALHDSSLPWLKKLSDKCNGGKYRKKLLIPQKWGENTGIIIDSPKMGRKYRNIIIDSTKWGELLIHQKYSFRKSFVGMASPRPQNKYGTNLRWGGGWGGVWNRDAPNLSLAFGVGVRLDKGSA